MDPINESSAALPGRAPTILLKLLALAWFLGAFACMGEVIEAIGMDSLAEAGRLVLVYAPIATVPAAIGWGLWQRRRWGRSGALGINWVVLAALVVSLLALGWENGVRAPLFFAPLAAPVIVIACLQAYFLTRPAVKALFPSPSSRIEFAHTPPPADIPTPSKMFSAIQRKRWLILGLVVALIGVAVAYMWRRNVDIRYQVAGPWAEQAGDRAPAGLTSQGRWFVIRDDQLHLASSPTAPPETSLALPYELLNSRFWRVAESADGNRLVCVNERGLAVWRASGAHELLHRWAITSESMAGPRVGRFIDGSIEYDRHKLVLAFHESPDGRLACIHAVGQTAFESGDSRDGVVFVRDLETGRDVARLVHPDSGLRVDLVAWSGDSQRLATYGEDNTLKIWEVARGAQCGSFKTDVDWIALSHDGTVLFTSKLRRDFRPLSATLSALRVADGSVIQRRELEWLRWATLSPNEKHLVAVTDEAISLLDSGSLRTLWTSSLPGQVALVAFRADSSELAATWGVPNEIYGSQAGVQAWDAVTGHVVLTQKGLAYDAATHVLGFCHDGRIVAGGQMFQPLNAR